MRGVPNYVLRLWLPDRPGALGQVASRIGAVGGDVVGIEILERGAGRAVDELIVALPEAGLVDLLVRQVTEVDGVDVEDLRPLAVERHDPGIAALRIAATLVDAGSAEALLSALVHDLTTEFDAEWAAVVELRPPTTLLALGEAPAAAWLAAFVEGSRHLEGAAAAGAGPDDLVWSVLPGRGAAVALGRRGRPFHWRERRQLGLLSQIADRLLVPRLTTR